MRGVVLALVLVLMPIGAKADTDPLLLSETWIEICSSEDKNIKSLCLSHIQGILTTTIFIEDSMIRVLGEDSLADGFSDAVSGLVLGCIGEANISTIQQRLIWVKFLNENPNTLHLPSIWTFSKSMNEAFPCE